MNPDDLRKFAADESAYVAARLVQYRDDDTKPPIVLIKLGALAKAVLDCTPSLAAKDAQSALATARTALYEIGVVLSAVNAALDGSEPGTYGPSDYGPDSFGGTDFPDTRIVTTQRADLPRDTIIATWPASGLRHGLVLVRGENDRRLFSEPIKGQYSVQTLAPDGLTAGEPWSTTPQSWMVSGPDGVANEWREETRPIEAKPCLPRYDVVPPKPAKSKAESKPKAADRTIDMFAAPEAPVAVPRKTIADYAPDDTQFAKWLGALNSALDGATKPHVDDAKVRDVFASWKAVNATEEKANPAAAFWHAAKAIIVGGTP